MTPEWWARMEALFLQALDCSPRERGALLDRECGGDEALRHEVEAMLATNERLGSFLEVPAGARTSHMDAPVVTGADDNAETAHFEAVARGRRCERCGGRYGEDHVFCPEDGSPLVEDFEALLGATLDGLYRIEALLGRGGMGAVYRARHVLLQDTVAIKVLPREFGHNPRWLQRFFREGHAARLFQHSSAVTVYDLRMTEDATVYLVLEYVEGETLRVTMGRGRFGAAEALGVLAPVAGCLDEAHRAGVVHRDVKPENVMLGGFGGGAAVTVKLLDLGIAKLFAADRGETSTQLTTPGAALGTPRYMSPEQWGEPLRDGGQEIDGRADVYSLAVVAYEMVVGEPPFAGKSWNELRRQHTSETPPPAHERVPELPAAYGLAVARAMSKDRADRFATAGEFVRTLRQALAPHGGEIETAPQSVETGAAVPQTAANPPTNLPEPFTTFVGREREVADVVRLLGPARLVTITGPGGIGKTRLAIRAASEALGRFPDGVWLVDLAPLSDPTFVELAVASAVGARQQSSASLLDVVCEYARERRFLLVLDNCEHLLEACSAVAARLLRSCPNVGILATSREELRLQSEVVWQAPPLDTRDTERLFVERAVLAHRDFAVTPRNAASIEELCRQLEGLPLAVELAAARMRVLTPAQMLERLGQRLDLLATRSSEALGRHRTLRASIEWSYELLAREERRVFEALSVFRGGWRLEAAEAVAGDPWPVTGDEEVPHGVVDSERATDVLDVLDRLRAASLVAVEDRAEEMRYRLLESIREYGLERAAASGAAGDLQRRHAAYFLALAEAAHPDLPGTHREACYGRLEEDYDNIRAALQWALEHDAAACLRAVVGLREFWTIHGHLTEQRQWLIAALERSPDSPPRVRGLALHGVGHVARNQGDPVTAREYFEETARVAREIADSRLLALSSHGLGWVAEMQGDLEAARAHWEASLAIAQREKVDRMIATLLNSLGELARQEGDWAAARAYYERSLEPARRSEFHDCLNAALGNLGSIACETGDLPTASACYRDALSSAQRIGSKDGISYALDGLATVAARRREWERAGRLAGAAEVLREQIGHEPDPADRALRARYLAEVREATGDARLETTTAEGRGMTLERAITYALSESERMNDDG